MGLDAATHRGGRRVSAVAAVSLSAACLVILVPWRARARPVAPLPVARSRSDWPTAGGPVWGATVAAFALLVHPAVALVAMAWPSCRRWQGSRRRRGEHRRATLRTLPESADLLGLGLGAGLSVPAAVRLVAPWAGGPFRVVFVEALRRTDAGVPFARALEDAAAGLDPAARPLISLLAAADNDGGAVVAGLLRVSDEARRRRRAAAEARARRLPVTILLPLVLCVLPAFGLLAVAPLVFTALGDLEFGF
jgi:tight adherence protein C